jgi:hypothetical protein
LAAGLAGLAIGLVAGYSLTRDSGPTTDRPLTAPDPVVPVSSAAGLNASIIPSRPTAAQTSAPATDQETQRVLQAIPSNAEWSTRYEWLRGLPPGDLPILVLGLCADSGPAGLPHEKLNLLRNALDQWWLKDSEGLLSWSRGLPTDGVKRFLVTEVLSRHLLEEDPRRAAAYAQAYAEEDAGWDGSEFQDATLVLQIDEAWKNPNITPAEMLDLYSRLSRGNSVHSRLVGAYPPSFDFRAFLEGLRALNVKDGRNPTSLPSDALRQWATIDPQGAAEWLLGARTSSGGHMGRLPFADWENIADAVAAKNGPQAYYEWAAQILTQSPRSWAKAIIAESKDGELAGIMACIQDPALRDRLLVEHAGDYHYSGGSIADRLALISSPELRLRAIANNPHYFHQWARIAGQDAGVLGKLGLTPDQVAEALSNTPTE